MAPTAIYTSSADYSFETPAQQEPQAPHGPVLAIGSLATASDEQYQRLVTGLSDGSKTGVERQMIDRVLDGGMTLLASHYSAIYIIISASDYLELTARIPVLIQQLFISLKPLATLHLVSVSPSDTGRLRADLLLAGFSILPLTASPTIIAQKPAQAASASLKSRVALPLKRRANGTAKETKARLWALESNTSTGTIDATSLLTASDLATPEPVCEPFVDGKRRKKACKNCTCGLAEVEAEEARQTEESQRLVAVDVSQDGGVTEFEASEKARILKGLADIQSGKVTSSCGSCFLGDAFRCASCPYLGLPAFEPGQKVEIDFNSDDI
ncbi:DUF689-domain-containing protein, partial [Dacryopinax primogenitus]